MIPGGLARNRTNIEFHNFIVNVNKLKSLSFVPIIRVKLKFCILQIIRSQFSGILNIDVISKNLKFRCVSGGQNLLLDKFLLIC